MSDDQTSAENLDDDKLTASYPPDVPLGLGDLAAQDVGAIGEVAEDDLAERVAPVEPVGAGNSFEALMGACVRGWRRG